MARHTFDVAAFRKQFPRFADVDKYPDDVLSGYFDMATCYMNDCDNAAIWGKCLQMALNLLTAHIALLFDLINDGENPVGITTSASVGDVSINTQVLQTTSARKAWLLQTAYGQQYLAFLTSRSSGGFYFGGRPESRAFRKVGGKF